MSIRYMGRPREEEYAEAKAMFVVNAEYGWAFNFPELTDASQYRAELMASCQSIEWSLALALHTIDR
jgi:hypothetical protein